MFQNKISAFGKSNIIKLFSFLALVVTVITGILYFSNSNFFNTAKAAVVCPSGYTWNGSVCQSNAPSSYTCPAGQSLGGNGAQCYRSEIVSYSCSQGTIYFTSSCVWILPPPPNFAFNGGSYGTQGCTGGATGDQFYPFNAPNGVRYCLNAFTWNEGYLLIGSATPNLALVFKDNATPVYTNVGATSYIPENGNVTLVSCISPLGVNIAIVGQSMTCTFNLSGAPSGVPYALPSEGMFAGLYDTPGDSNTYLGNSSLCTIAAVLLTCTNVPSTGGQIGTTEVVIHRPGVAWYPNKGTVTLSFPTINPDILLSGTVRFSCGISNSIILGTDQTPLTYSPSSVPTTTCTGSLPAQMVLDTNNPLTLKIGNIGSGNLSTSNILESANCTIGTLGSGVGGTTPFTCLNVPLGSLTGSQPIQAKLGTNSTISGYGKFLTLPSFVNVYTSEVFYDGEVNFLKGVTGTTSAYNNVLHKDWRLGVSGNETRISLNNFKSYTDLQPTTQGRYICKIGVRPSGSNSSYIDLINDQNNNGNIESTEITSSNSTNIPYNITTNSCQALFTNVNFVTDNTPPNNDPTTLTVSPNGGGQPSITSNLAKTYNWDVKVEVLDMSKATTPGDTATAPTIATFNSGVGFKFAAIIPGG